MDTLVHYKRILVRSHAESLEAGERDRLIDECTGLLKQLVELDPARKRRYEEIGQSLFLDAAVKVQYLTIERGLFSRGSSGRRSLVVSSLCRQNMV
jgi:hypothetical protein